MADSYQHPEPCSNCDEYYAYQGGLCWQCWQDAQEAAADEKIGRYQEEKHFVDGERRR